MHLMSTPTPKPKHTREALQTSMMFPSKNNKILNLKSINQNILNAKYAVRGELAIRADQITRVKRKKD